MKLIRPLVGLLSVVALVASFSPMFVSADYACSTDNVFNLYTGDQCDPGKLLVVMRVLNPNNGVNKVPNDFTVAISGDVNRPSFPGSQSGTEVSVRGVYSVAAAQLPGYEADYSVGCQGTLFNKDKATCVITEHASPIPSAVLPYPYTYPYPNTTLTCSPSMQTVGLGQSVTFTAQGQGGPFNWKTSDRTFLAIGSTLTTTLQNTGTQTVTVYAGTQSATCTVNVVPGFVAPTSGGYIAPQQRGVVLTPTFVPALPNTGFEPMSAASAAFAFVALAGLMFAFFPYVRKAFATVLG